MEIESTDRATNEKLISAFEPPHYEHPIPSDVSYKLSQPLYFKAKRIIDLVAAGVALGLLLPLILITALIIKLTSSGKVFYRQIRIGRGGVPFSMYKFRSMYPYVEESLEDLLRGDPDHRTSWEQYHKLLDDPRLTPIGRIMRRWSIDELPQLWNVIKGEMSLVGPRPFLPEQKEDYGENYPYYVQVRPGMTGLWQINGRNLTSFTDRVEWDCHYIRHWSMPLDVRILIRTIGTVLRGTGAY